MPQPKVKRLPPPPVATNGPGVSENGKSVSPPQVPTASKASPHLGSSRSRFMRNVLASACAVISLTGFTWAVRYKIQNVEPSSRTGVLPYNEASKAAIDLRIAQSSDFLKVCVLLLGGLAALVLAKSDEARIGLGDRPETLMFICAAMALIGSWMWHELYLTELSHYLVEGARTCFDKDEKCVPDVFNGPIEYFYRFQISFLVLGAIQAAITLISAHRLKENPQ